MKRHSYRERDYAFGQMMVTLRTTIGLTSESRTRSGWRCKPWAL
ncbi:MAG TPA: hypothetical protein VFN02_12195 [Ktedonobacteraceae bacterium]|nr:hypothetical protein [Ktedonobacteraceae bacterium]